MKQNGTLPDGSRQGTERLRQDRAQRSLPAARKPHRFFFRLYALDAVPPLDPGATRRQLLDAIKGHALGEAELMGRYGRS